MCPSLVGNALRSTFLFRIKDNSSLESSNAGQGAWYTLLKKDSRPNFHFPLNSL